MRPLLVVPAVVLVCLALARPARAEVSLARPQLLEIAEGERRELPLVRGRAAIEVRGPIAQVRLVQTFANPHDVPIEAIYVFPLPADGAVGGMTMTVGARTIHARIERRDRARAIYEEARDAGKTAALLEQERPNVFTQSVANILPGERIDVDLTYDVLLAPVDGVYALAIPTVVGPRYLPEAGVADADRITPRYTPPGTSTGQTLALALDVDAGLPITEITSPTHRIVATKVSHARYQVALADREMVLDRDFVLRWKVEVTSPALAVLGHRAPGAELGHLALIVQPPPSPPAEPARRELVFVVDTSGSMSGEPIDRVRRAMRYALDRLGPEDTFRILRFSDRVDGHRGGDLLPATPAELRAARRWVDGLEASGGTEIVPAIRAALSGKPAGGRTRYVLFLTDGYVGHDTETIAEVQRRIDPHTHLFSFGVGSSVNRYLLDGLAREGRGVAHDVLLDEDPAVAVERFFAAVELPVLGDLSIDWGDLEVVDATPGAPHLFAGHPVVVTARYRAGGSTTVTVRGTRAGEEVALRLPVALPEQGGRGAVLARLWARRRIAALSSEALNRPDPAIAEEITRIALDHALMSAYTSFVAVLEERRADGTFERVEVPVEMPAGVRHDTTLGFEATYLVHGMNVSGSRAPESLYLVEGIAGGWGRRNGLLRDWRFSLDLGGGLDAGGGGTALYASAGLERRLAGGIAAGLTVARWDRDDAGMTTVLGTLARWAVLGLFDLRLGLGAVTSEGASGIGWQVRLGAPLPLALGDALRAELELRLDGARAGEDRLLGTGLGVGVRF